MTGRTVLHFEIQEKLGQGGMGVVYKALDTKLNRTVALKFLPAQLNSDENAKARFIQEAQAASALDHANICSIYEIGETKDGEVFIAMAYYDGQTLKYRLAEESFAIDRATEVAIQIANALERAHEAGIVHRDVKPANIMLTNRGEVKLLDFGLAKLIGGSELTIAGSTLGTAAYMSPEQAKGEDVTGASDIWALGAVMYEMYTGTKPFAAEYDQALMYSILNEDPNPPQGVRPDLPMRLSEMVSSCLSKQPAGRPSLEKIISVLEGSSGLIPVAEPVVQKPKERSLKRPMPLVIGIVLALVIAAGVWLVATGGGGTSATSTAARTTDEGNSHSVAVLPFELRSATDQEASAVFAGGMHDDVIAQLSKISGLKVIARTSVMQYENTTRTVRDISRELNVASVLEGTIQRAGNRIRVNVSLIDGATESPLWNETYDEELTTENVFSIQTDLAKSIAAALQTTLSPEEVGHLSERPNIAMEAYELYTRGMYIGQSTSFGTRNEEAADIMLQALDLEPEYAQAHAELANLYLNGIQNGIWLPEEKLDEARSHITRALEINPELGSGYVALGYLESFELNFVQAEQAFLKAISLTPGDPTAHRRYAALLYSTGQAGEALASARRAVEADPLSLEGRQTLADILFSTEQYEASLAETLKIQQMDPNIVWIYYNLGYCYAMLDRMDEAIASFEEARKIDSADPYNTLGLSWAHAKAGNRTKALDLFSEIEDNAGVLREKAIILGMLGDLDEAFEYLDRAYELSPGVVAVIAGDASVPDEMKKDPRFTELVERLGLHN